MISEMIFQPSVCRSGWNRLRFAPGGYKWDDANQKVETQFLVIGDNIHASWWVISAQRAACLTFHADPFQFIQLNEGWPEQSKTEQKERLMINRFIAVAFNSFAYFYGSLKQQRHWKLNKNINESVL